MLLSYVPTGRTERVSRLVFSWLLSVLPCWLFFSDASSYKSKGKTCYRPLVGVLLELPQAGKVDGKVEFEFLNACVLFLPNRPFFACN